MKTTGKILILTGLLPILLLAGCSSDNTTSNTGSGGSVGNANEMFVPDSAGVSNGAFISYIGSLDRSDEATEPLALKESFAISADEDNDPQPLT